MTMGPSNFRLRLDLQNMDLQYDSLEELGDVPDLPEEVGKNSTFTLDEGYDERSGDVCPPAQSGGSETRLRPTGFETRGSQRSPGDVCPPAQNGGNETRPGKVLPVSPADGLNKRSPNASQATCLLSNSLDPPEEVGSCETCPLTDVIDELRRYIDVLDEEMVPPGELQATVDTVEAAEGLLGVSGFWRRQRDAGQKLADCRRLLLALEFPGFSPDDADFVTR